MWRGLVPATRCEKRNMGGLYKPRKNTIEYVTKTEELVKYTIHLMMNLPNEWRDFLTTPVAEAVLAIENSVEKANAVYIQKPGTRAELPKYYAALRERRNYLYEALRGFRVFDKRMEHLLGHLDLVQSEKKRLKNIVISLIEEARRSDKEIPEIRVIARASDFAYTAANGSHVYRLKLTSRQKDHMLKLEYGAYEAIYKQVKAENNRISKVEASMAKDSGRTFA